ncbi:DUF4097 domain-containing protein [Streptomyces phaeoluteigriseus]|uniref:DUF4097 domain-containing protein n=1 Tax=Streptomyces phaeoluteigriseus TaxID=114686 RepID=A0ABY4ZAP6_9ACTN|nr:DUF4097 family beta strand repeat-containing protein [Streptomyces phaeoluteigriseus]USQ85595.1 DUF4097 domain-containing protein [Streptomyces phaeoluteigriseus]
MLRRRLWRLNVALAVLGLTVACAGRGDRSDNEATGGAPPLLAAGSHLMIVTDNGLRLRPADAGRVAVDDHVDRRWSRHDDTWTLDLSCPDRAEHTGAVPDAGSDGACPRMPRVSVPDAVRVTVRARNAGIDVAGVAAALDLTTVNGDVTVADSGRDDGAVRLSTRNGSVRATAVEGSRLYAATVNGDIVLGCAEAPSDVTAATTNGSVDVTVPHDSPAYRVTATTDNGTSRPALGGSDDGQGRAMTLSTVNGDVTARRE